MTGKELVAAWAVADFTASAAGGGKGVSWGDEQHLTMLAERIDAALTQARAEEREAVVVIAVKRIRQAFPVGNGMAEALIQGIYQDAAERMRGT